MNDHPDNDNRHIDRRMRGLFRDARQSEHRATPKFDALLKRERAERSRRPFWVLGVVATAAAVV